jgi:ubiquinone/menaquinone biosynthesis C-methylase UbiE
MPPKWDGAAYAKYRPSYPPHLYDTILQYGGEKAVGGIAVDCGCASGQVTSDLAKKGFSKVIGIDTSQSQLQAALENAPENVEYRVGSAEATGLPDNYADLITAATALHWFNIPKFFSEACRILKPNGVLAAWSYIGAPIFPGDSKAADEAYSRIQGLLWEFFDPKLQRTLEQGYSVYLETAQTHFAENVEFRNIPIEWNVSVDIIAGFVQSWSPFTAFVEKEGEAVAGEHIEKLKNDIRNAVGVEKDSDPFVVTLPSELILAKDPLKDPRK